MVIGPCAVQFWSEIILVISNHTYDFSPNCTPLSSITIINLSEGLESTVLIGLKVRGLCFHLVIHTLTA